MTASSTPIVLNGNVFFASDFHFGAPDAESSRRREANVVAWLDTIQPAADHLFLLGDIFDFWFEYKDVVPKGFCRFFAKLAELRQAGVEIYYFTGNHDMWVKTYFADEFGMHIFRQEQLFEINGRRCLIGHGDGLDPADHGYQFIKKLFAMKLNIALYGALPPRWAFGIARFCSHHSRKSHEKATLDQWKAKAQRYTQATLDHIRCRHAETQAEIFIYGHTHYPQEVAVQDGLIYYNTGDWLRHNSYLAWTPEGIVLHGGKAPIQ